MSAPLPLSSEFSDYLPELLPADQHQPFLAACARPLKKSIRFNSLTTSPADHLAIASNHGWQLTAIPWCSEGYWLANMDGSEVGPGNSLEHVTGRFYIQEASSMLPVAVMQRLWQQHHGDQLPQRVLDMAAAPGSKTTQLAAWLGPEPTLVANEYAASRVKVLYTNLSRCAVTNSIITNHDGRVFGDALPAWFDAILVDAPCSGEGTVRKDPTALANWSRAAIADLAATQQALLASAFAALRPGGLLVYSTCSLNAEENDRQISRFVADHSDAEALDLRPLWPQLNAIHHDHGHLQIWPHRYDAEGFFVAAMVKTGTPVTAPSVAATLSPRFPFQPWPIKEQRQWRDWLTAELGLHLVDGDYWRREESIWLFPQESRALLGHLKTNRLGIKIGEIHGKEFRLSHDAATAFGMRSNRLINLTADQARDYLNGLDLDDDEKRKGDWIVTWSGQPLGLVRAAQGRLRNRLPRDRVRQTNIAVDEE